MPICCSVTALLLLPLVFGHLAIGDADPEGLFRSSPTFQSYGARSLKEQAKPRIAGGNPAVCGRYPYMASLRDRFNFHRCGGVLVDHRWVLTAAHCVDPNTPNTLERPIVVVGACNLDDKKNENGVVEMLLTENAIVHENWTGSVDDGNDIALLQLEKESELTPVGLPSEENTLLSGEALVAIGWGQMENGESPEVLQQAASIRFIDNRFCEDEEVWGPIVQSTMLCAFGFGSGQDVCQGDSGGPLLQAFAPDGNITAGDPEFDFVVGITSFGPGEGCGPSGSDEDKPSVFTKTSSFRQWIEKTMKPPQEVLSPSLPSEKPPPETSSPTSEATSEASPTLTEPSREAASPPPMETVPEPDPSPAVEPSPVPVPSNPEPSPPMEPSPKPQPSPPTKPTPRPSPPPVVKPDVELSPVEQAAADERLLDAVLKKDATAVESALGEGADPDATTDGTPVLVKASEEGLTAIVEALLMYGADPEKRNTNRITALYKAAFMGNVEVVVALLKWGADPDSAVDDGSTPLYQASWFGHFGAVEALIKGGADVNKARGDGSTPLYIASEYGKINNVFLLLDADADPNMQRDDGSSPLIGASKNGRCTSFPTTKHVDVVMALLAANADPNLADSKGNTPLHFASITLGLHSEMLVDALLDESAEVDVQARDGRTPLMWAAHYGNAGTAKALLAANAVASISADDGSTAADLICKCMEIGGLGGECRGVIPCAADACQGPGDMADIASLLP